MLIRVKNLQTRDCYYPIYHGKTAIDWDIWNNPIEWREGYWFEDDELPDCDSIIGPFDTLDAVYKAQAQYWKAVMSL